MGSLKSSSGQRITYIAYLPDALSLARVLLAPVVFFFLTLRIDLAVPYLSGHITWGDFLAGCFFFIALITDLLDGYIARRYNLATKRGKLIDSLADKVLVVVIMLALSELQRVPAWIAAVVIVREFIMTGLRLVALTEGVTTAASRGGKLKAVFQFIAIGLLVLRIPGGMILMWVAMLLTVWSGITATVMICRQMNNK